MIPRPGPSSGAAAEASKKQRPIVEDQTETLRRERQRSMSATAGICSSCARNGIAASTPMAKLLAPSATAKPTRKTPVVSAPSLRTRAHRRERGGSLSDVCDLLRAGTPGCGTKPSLTRLPESPGVRGFRSRSAAANSSKACRGVNRRPNLTPKWSAPHRVDR